MRFNKLCSISHVNYMHCILQNMETQMPPRMVRYYNKIKKRVIEMLHIFKSEAVILYLLFHLSII